jgi:hypothetical protein
VAFFEKKVHQKSAEMCMEMLQFSHKTRESLPTTPTQNILKSFKKHKEDNGIRRGSVEMESYLINKSLINVNRFRGGRKNTPKYTTLYNIKYLSNQDMIAFLYIIATKRECEKSSSVITTAEIVIMMHFVGFLFLTSLTILPECNEAVKDDDLRCARYIFLSFFLSLLKKNILI